MRECAANVNYPSVQDQNDTYETQEPFFLNLLGNLFIVLTAFGFNMFWRKSFILSRDLMLVILCETIAFAIFLASHFDFMAKDQFFLYCTAIILPGFLLLTYKATYAVKTGENNTEPLRKALDQQDIVNFIFTGMTVGFLVRHHDQIV